MTNLIMFMVGYRIIMYGMARQLTVIMQAGRAQVIILLNPWSAETGCRHRSIQGIIQQLMQAHNLVSTAASTEKQEVIVKMSGHHMILAKNLFVLIGKLPSCLANITRIFFISELIDY